MDLMHLAWLSALHMYICTVTKMCCYSALSLCIRCQQCQRCIWSAEDVPTASTLRAGTRYACLQPCMFDTPQVICSLLQEVCCIMYNSADHKNAKQEANNLLWDTKKTLREQLQGAESEIRKLKVRCNWKVGCLRQYCVRTYVCRNYILVLMIDHRNRWYVWLCLQPDCLPLPVCTGATGLMRETEPRSDCSKW